MAVNGIEIKVGQTWATRQAGLVRIIQESDHPNYKWQTNKTTVSDNGEQFISSKGAYDLVELVSEALPEVPFPAIDAHSAANDSLLQKLVPGYISASGDSDESLFFHALPEPHAGSIWVKTDEDRALDASLAQAVAAIRRSPHGLAENPKDAIGSIKLPLHLWPAEATAIGCLGMLEGKEKYGRNNYIAGEGVVASIYIDAAKRHIDAWFSGEEVSPDTQNDHLGNALACLAIIVKTRAHGKLIDDRDFAPNPGYRKLVEELTPNVKRLQELFTDKSPRHFTIADKK